VVVLVLAGAPACILFGVGDDLQGGPAVSDSGADTDIVDTSTIEGALTDSTTPLIDSGVDAAPAFDCRFIDATFCDSFDRDGAIAVGAPWTSIKASTGCTLGVDGELTTTFDASTGQQGCYLLSNSIPTKNGHFTLDFDVSFTTDTSNTMFVLLAQIVVAFPGGTADSGVQIQNFQLFLDGAGSGRVGMFDYFPDAASSAQPGNQYVAYTFESATPFARPSPPCHITWDVDAITPTAAATATCDGIVSTTIPSGSSTKPRPGFEGAATLDFGFANPEVPLPAWSITYDNMIFRAAP
jgi:hypothetical protein